MAETQLILQQRFLETEGELGRNHSKAVARFNEYHAALIQHSDITQIFESLSRELHSYEYGIEHVRLVQQNSMREMANYERMEEEIHTQIQATHAALIVLQQELAAARARRTELEQYEVLTKSILELPSRDATTQMIAHLREQEQTLIKDGAALRADLRIKQSKYQDVMKSMENLSSEWTTEEASDAKAREVEEAEERRRAAEESLLNEQALEEKLRQSEADGGATSREEEEAAAQQEEEEKDRHDANETEEKEKEDQQPSNASMDLEEGETDGGATNNNTNNEQQRDVTQPTLTPSSSITEGLNETVLQQQSSGGGTPVPAESPSDSPTPMDTQ